MLKNIPKTVFDCLDPDVKCGEIYLKNKFRQLTIVCTLCDFKLFDFSDFLRHLEYVHQPNDEEDPTGSSIDTELVVEEGDNITEIKCENEDSCDDKDFEPIEQEYLIEDLRTEDNEELSFDGGYDEGVENKFDENSENISIWGQRECDRAEKLKSEATGSLDESDDDDDDDGKEDDFEIKTKKRKRVNYKRDQPTDFQCELCKKYYFSAATLRQHRKTQHKEDHQSDGNENKFSSTSTWSIDEKCTVCGFEFTDKRTINTHYHMEHGGFPCSFCGKKFKEKHDQRRHEEIHNDEKNFVCDWENCGKRFITIRYLRTHLKVHINKKNFVCDVCGYACRTPDMLRLHYRKHTGEKPYPCPQCGKRFASSSAVREHQATHMADRPHVCDVCGASFGRAKSLYHHKHLHSVEKKFKCKICDRPFAQLAGLSMHMKKHKEESGLL